MPDLMSIMKTIQEIIMKHLYNESFRSEMEKNLKSNLFLKLTPQLIKVVTQMAAMLKVSVGTNKRTITLLQCIIGCQLMSG